MGPELEPPALRPPAARSPANNQGNSDNRKRHWIVWSLLGSVFVLALLVLTGLPNMITDHSVATPVADTAPTPPEPIAVSPDTIPAPAPAPVPVPVPVPAPASTDTVSSPAGTVSMLPDTDSDLQGSRSPSTSSIARQDAEQALQAFLRLRGQPDLTNAEIWAADSWLQAMETAANGDDHYGHDRFSDALLAYEKATNLLMSLQTSRPQVLADSLSHGWRALQNNDIESSTAAFERALSIQSDLEEAITGLGRAKVRHRVLGLMEDGKEAESTSSLQLAADAYASALQLDPSYAPAQTAFRHVSKMLDSLAFQLAMSNALENLEAGKFNAAEKALGVAAKIDPDAPAVKDARQRLNTARRQFELDRLRLQAEQRTAAEQWSAAADLYQKALALDAQTAYAQSGLSYARERLKLHAQFDHYLNDPDRLWSQEPLANADKLLEANQHIPQNEPLLAAKAATLREAVHLAAQPVHLVIQSDNLTEVVVYHVGPLGKFDQKEIALRPGRYTVVGSRPGYRDVREVVTLSHSSAAPVVLVRCEEQI